MGDDGGALGRVGAQAAGGLDRDMQDRTIDIAVTLLVMRNSGTHATPAAAIRHAGLP